MSQELISIATCRTAGVADSSWFKTYNAIREAVTECPDFRLGDDIYHPLPRTTSFLMKCLLRSCGYGRFPGGFHRLDSTRVLEENAFLKALRDVDITPDLFLHVCGLCIPEKAALIGMHAVYQDASVPGFLPYLEVTGGRVSDTLLRQHLDITRRYYDRAKAIFTTNEWTRESILSHFGVTEDKVRNIGFGVHLDPYHGPKDYDRNLLLIVLRRGFERNKGLNLLLGAFKLARKRHPSLELAVVGTTLGTADGVTYYENCPRETTVELFRRATLYVMPALAEPNGVTYLEALASRTPIIGLNRFAFPELCGFGKYGFIVRKTTPENVSTAILDALSDRSRLERMGRDGQAFCMARYNWRSVMDEMAAHLRTM